MQIPKYFYYRVKTDRKGLTVEIEDASDVDVAEVVRCAECKHSKTDGMDDPAIYCKKWDRWEMP
ncbi:MAG: hypothetical protein II642_06085, partial [Firmicutes bacterium]|nr:hypothetical protein [Bacillota bacterium]